MVFRSTSSRVAAGVAALALASVASAAALARIFDAHPLRTHSGCALVYTPRSRMFQVDDEEAGDAVADAGSAFAGYVAEEAPAVAGRLRDGAEDLLERVKETVAAGAQAVEEAADAAQAAAAEEATEQAEAAAQAEEKPEKGTAAEAATEQETEQPQEK